MNNDYSSFLNSDAWRNFQAQCQAIKKNVPEVISNLSIALTPYAELYKNLKETFTPFILALADISKRLQDIKRIGEAEFVYWDKFPNAVLDQISQTEDKQGILNILSDWLEHDNCQEVMETLNRLLDNEELKENPILSQAISAYNREDYDLSALGFTALIDRMLSFYSGDTGTRIIARAKELEDKIKIHGEESLSDEEYNCFTLLLTYSTAVESFGAHSDFNQSEPDLNRHWIMHGRRNRRTEKIDCIRLIHFLYGTVLIGNIGNLIGESKKKSIDEHEEVTDS